MPQNRPCQSSHFIVKTVEGGGLPATFSSPMKLQGLVLGLTAAAHKLPPINGLQKCWGLW